MAVKLTTVDLNYILAQIKMAEAGQPPVNPLLSFGLREVAGTNNNLVAGQSTFGAADEIFPAVTDQLLQGGYTSASGIVSDAQPRLISNLISDQTTSNPAAVAAAAQQASFLGLGYQNTTDPGLDGTFGATTAYKVTAAGADGLLGTGDDVIAITGPATANAPSTITTGTRASLLHTLSAGADGVLGVTTAFQVIGKGADNVLGTADDLIAEYGANGLFNGNVAGSDDIIGTRAQLLHTIGVGADGVSGTADDVVTDDVVSDDVPGGNLATPTDASSSSATFGGLGQSTFINNVTPDNGLSSPSNSWFTFFGQFFDHGLDMIDKGGSGSVFIPLSPTDPLYVPNSPTNFMVLTRATNLPGPDGVLGTADDVHQATNQTSPFVDQSQTYASDPSHQIFLREYMVGADGKLHSSGDLLGHAKANGKDGMATWGDLKANAASFFGIRLTDADVGNVPLLATDAYGNFIAGAHGLPQLVVRNLDGTTSLVEGNLANPISIDTNAYKAFRTGHAFINDMSRAASPVDDAGRVLLPDTDTGASVDKGIGQFDANGTPADPTKFYNNELLDAHYVAGDGRVNENIGLTAVQDIFHSEHDRLVAEIKATVQAELAKGNVSFALDWVEPGVTLTGAGRVIQANEWNGERLFQAAKFGNETEYMHLVFEEFARYVDPAVHVAGPVNVHIDPAITSEFANVVYRFGHSMLDENVNIYVLGADGKPVIDPATGQPKFTQEGLIQAFTNPLKFAGDANMTADLVLGTVNQVSNSIDEFVTGSLRNNLLGLPLDLAALNIARGRDVGVAPLNLVRNQLYALSGEAQLKAYANWAQFGTQLKYAESLINFVAAYGTHASVVNAVTLADKRAAADYLVHHGTIGDKFNPSVPADVDAYNFMQSQGQYANNRNDARAVHDATGAPAQWSTGSVTGLDTVDMWIGGLAEKISLFGGQLGSTFEYVFRTQMEALQDGDRFYYLPRIEGTDYEESLQDSSFAALIRANTDIKHLPGNVFLVPEYTIEAADYFNADGSTKDPTGATWLHSANGQLLVTVNPDKSLQFLGENNFLGNTIVLGGTERDDRLIAGAADDDTVYGDGGNDSIDGGGGNDFLFGGDGNDIVIGGQGDDVLHGDAGNDAIFGGDGIDNMFGGDGNDYMEGGRGADVIFGGLGNDILIGNEGVGDELIGGEGDDWLESRGGQGQSMFGDSGAPTGGTPLYSGNDVMIGGVAGGDVMKGFNGDDIMVGQGGFTKFTGGLGFDWGSYEYTTQGVSEDMNRKEFISPIGAADTIRDVWQHTEGASGSNFDDVIIGSNDTKLLVTKDTLDNVNLISGLQSFFELGAVSFGAGNILLGGGGNDVITGGGGNDIIDGDAYLHVALTSYAAGAQIIRQIAYDPNGNTAQFDFFSRTFTGVGHVNRGNIDVAVFNDVMANYDVASFGPDNQGFLSISHLPAAAGGGGGATAGVDDGTDRIRNIERLQFADITVAIDSQGNQISSSVAMPTDPNYAIDYAPYYNAVPVGKPVITETNNLDPTVTVTVGETLTAGIAAIKDIDGIASPMHYQWQALDLIRGDWVDIKGATAATFVPTAFQVGSLGLRVKASFVDGQGYTETVISAPTTVVTLAGNVNTAPTIVTGQQFNGIGNVTSPFGAAFDYFSPLGAPANSIFTDQQTAAINLLYSATLADGAALDTVGLTFSYDATTGYGEFKAANGFVDHSGNPIAAGQLGVRVTATDTGPGTPLSVVNTFYINILPLDAKPVAKNDAYTILEGATLTVAKANVGVLANDTDADIGDTLRARLVAGPAHGSLTLNTNGTFAYTPGVNFNGADSFTYQATDNFLGASNIATVNITVTPAVHLLSAALLHDTGASPTDLITNDATLTGKGYFNAAVFAAVDGAAPVKFATADAGGLWTGKPVLSDGTHTIVVSETDGTPGSVTFGRTDTKTLSFTVDTTPPPVTVSLVQDTGSLANDGITSNGALSGKGDPKTIAAPNSSVVVSVDGVAAATVPTDAGGNWSFNPFSNNAAHNLDGAHAISVTGTDLAGNSKTATLNMTLLTAPPPPPSIKSFTTVQKAAGNGITAYTLSGTAAAGSKLALSNGTPLGTTTASATGAWSFTVPVAAPGSDFRTTLNVVATDLAGNVSAPQSQGLVVGGNGGDILTATAGLPSLLAGFGGADILTGSTGNDTLDGGNGGDTMRGGAGNDFYIVDGLNDVVIENANEGIDTVQASINSYTLTANVENLIGINIGFKGTGNALANVITGGSGADTLDDGGIGGADTLIGGAGNDTYVIHNAGDLVTELAGEGIDTVNAAINSYTLGVNLENLNFVGTGNFVGRGNGLDNLISGDVGNDTLDGGAGNDTLEGGGGADILLGGDGIDTLLGGGGADTLTGGNGADILTGGAGADIFVLTKGDANGDLMTDFGIGNDAIRFTGYQAGATVFKFAAGNNNTPTTYQVRSGIAVVDTFKLAGNVTLTAADYSFI